MCKRVSVFLALAFALFGTRCWASIGPQTCTPSESQGCTNTFSPGVTEGVYDFTGTGDGKLTVHFVTVLMTFNLTVTFNHTIDPLDPHVFPEGTVCTRYSTNVGNRCDQYDFTGNAGGPHGVPVKDTDYRGLITLTLDYFAFQTAQSPAFGHAPGDITTFTKEILTAYFQRAFSDPVKIGKVPGLSSVVSLDEPLDGSHCFQFVSPTFNQPFTVGQEIEVEFRLFASAACSGKPIRDRDARLTVALTDSNGNFVSLAPVRNEEGKKFRFDPEDGVNVRELDTEGLAPGSYTITVFSDEFSPHSVSFVLAP